MTIAGLTNLEEEAFKEGLLLRVQVRRPLGLWIFRVVVAEENEPGKIQLLGEMKGWAFYNKTGLQLDTMKVSRRAPSGIGHLIWTATMSWALEETPCLNARLLAIYDENHQHSRLKSYFIRRGFILSKEVGSSPIDLPLRLVWGGAGALMKGDCRKVRDKSYRLWLLSRSLFPSSSHDASA